MNIVFTADTSSMFLGIAIFLAGFSFGMWLGGQIGKLEALQGDKE